MFGSWRPEAGGRDDKIWILDWEIRVYGMLEYGLDNLIVVIIDCITKAKRK